MEDDEGKLHPEFAYRYVVDGADFTSDRLSFFEFVASPFNVPRELVDRLPVDTRTTCYVDPTSPESAVLDRSVSAAGIIMGMFWTATILLALFLTFPQIFQRTMPIEALLEEIEAEHSKLELESERLGCVTFSVYPVLLAFSGYYLIRELVFANAMVTPIMVISLLGCMISTGLVVWTFALVTDPKITLKVSSRTLRPGSTLSISWAASGRVKRLKRIRLAFVCIRNRLTDAKPKEPASSIEDSAENSIQPELEFSREELLIGEQEVVTSRPFGDMEFTLPNYATPSFSNLSGSVVWWLELEGETNQLGGIAERFEMTVESVAWDESFDSSH